MSRLHLNRFVCRVGKVCIFTLIKMQHRKVQHKVTEAQMQIRHLTDATLVSEDTDDHDLFSESVRKGGGLSAKKNT